MPHLSLLLTLSLVAGLAAGVLTDRAPTVLLSCVLAGGWLAALAAFHRRSAVTELASLAIATAAAGWLLGAAAVDRALNPPLRTMLEQRVGGFAKDQAGDAHLVEPIVIEGRLRADGSLTDTGVVLRLDVERVWLGPCPEAAAGGVSLSVSGALHAAALPEWTMGRVIRVPALLRRPARYLNRGLADQERALARRGVALVGSVKSATLVEVVARGRWWEEAAGAARQRTREAIARHVAPRSARAAAIATALLIGDRAAIDVETERRLQEAGTYHVIAISGGNIAILAGIVFWALSLIGVRGRQAALVTITILTAYAIVASGGPSVARATLMAALYLAVRAIDQRTAATNALAISGAALLLVNPLSVTDVGFWLTFGATGAILAGASRLRGPFAKAQGRPLARIGLACLTLLVASICAELALAPVGAAAFQRVTIAGLPLNFIAIPCMTLVQVAAMALVMLDAIGAGWLAQCAAVVVQWGTTGLTESTRLLDHAPWLTWRVPPPAVWAIASYYTLVAAWWWRPRSRLVPAIAACLFLWIIVAPAARVRQFGDRRLHLTLVDVGQGDAMLVTFPNGRTLIVDAGGGAPGGAFDIGDRVVAPALRARGLLAVDYLAVTHGDPDHIGGARALVRDFGPREIWWGVPVANHAPTALVRAEADRARATWRTLQRGDHWEIGGVELRVHHPPPPDWERQKVRNDDSLVIELRFGSVSVLLTGDISREVEEMLLPTLDLLPTVVLKVPHHGSGTSSSAALVDKLQPRIALIGVGRSNPYGHPVPYVLGRYFEAETEVFRTDRDGQIEVSTDGVTLTARTFTGRAWEKR